MTGVHDCCQSFQTSDASRAMECAKRQDIHILLCGNITLNYPLPLSSQSSYFTTDSVAISRTTLRWYTVIQQTNTRLRCYIAPS